LRIGIGHPGERDEVTGYVLKDPRREERELIDEAMQKAQSIAHLIIEGKTEAAMLKLHSA
jgi:PTH1 family peptidyl-tRNA hydrolase